MIHGLWQNTQIVIYFVFSRDKSKMNIGSHHYSVHNLFIFQLTSITILLSFYQLLPLSPPVTMTSFRPITSRDPYCRKLTFRLTIVTIIDLRLERSLSLFVKVTRNFVFAMLGRIPVLSSHHTDMYHYSFPTPHQFYLNLFGVPHEISPITSDTFIKL